jgi:hypothetical protein
VRTRGKRAKKYTTKQPLSIQSVGPDRTPDSLEAGGWRERGGQARFRLEFWPRPVIKQDGHEAAPGEEDGNMIDKVEWLPSIIHTIEICLT